MKQKFTVLAAIVALFLVTGIAPAYAGAGIIEISNVRVEAPVIIGSPVMVTWESNGVSEVTLALLRDGKYVKNLIWNIPNTGSVSWTPDSAIQLGNGYQIVVTQSGGSDPYIPAISAKSNKFSIKKLPIRRK